MAKLEGHTIPVWKAYFSLDGRWILTRDYFDKTFYWDARSFARVPSVPPDTAWATDAPALDHDGLHFRGPAGSPSVGLTSFLPLRFTSLCVPSTAKMLALAPVEQCFALWRFE